MMNVQIMRQIVDAVEQGRLPEVARVAAQRWSDRGDIDSLSYVRSSANHVFRLRHDGRPCFLRLAHESERHPSAIQAELDFIQHVGHMGLRVAQPLASMNGQLVEEVAGGDQRYYAVLFEGLQGDQLELDALDEARYRAWGQSLALVHRASQTFPFRPERSSWRDQIDAALRALPPEELALAAVLQAGLRWLESVSVPERDYGLIHGDFELDNLVWDGEQVQALDFDDATYAWYGVDFAAALPDVLLAPDLSTAQREERIAWFMAGYAAVRPLPTGLEEAMPRLLTLLLALKVARVLRAYATTTDFTAPVWLARMRLKHERWLEAQWAQLTWPDA